MLNALERFVSEHQAAAVKPKAAADKISNEPAAEAAVKPKAEAAAKAAADTKSAKRKAEAADKISNEPAVKPKPAAAEPATAADTKPAKRKAEAADKISNEKPKPAEAEPKPAAAKAAADTKPAKRKAEAADKISNEKPKPAAAEPATAADTKPAKRKAEAEAEEKAAAKKKKKADAAALVARTLSTFITPIPITHPTVAEPPQQPQPNNNDNDDEYITTQRYGRTYKRKKFNTLLGKRFLCAPGFRYCTQCKQAQPLSEFYTHVKRFVCKKHHAKRVHEYRQYWLSGPAGDTKVLELVGNAWEDLYKVCPVLGYKQPNYCSSDMRLLIHTLGIPLAIVPRFLPIDPSLPMRPRNVAIVSMSNFAMATKLYVITNSRAGYIHFIQLCNLIPHNADPGIPGNPYVNPKYERKDIDVCPLIRAELTLEPKERPPVDTVLAMSEQEGCTILKKQYIGARAFDFPPDPADYMSEDEQIERDRTEPNPTFSSTSSPEVVMTKKPKLQHPTTSHAFLYAS